MLQEIALSPDELEAIRLSDLEGMYQDAAAGKMGVSRATFGRILSQARQKIADALVHGKVLSILDTTAASGGWFLVCPACGFRWMSEQPAEESVQCPRCGAAKPETWTPPGRGRRGRGWGRR
jgi:rubrerythrin